VRDVASGPSVERGLANRVATRVRDGTNVNGSVFGVILGSANGTYVGAIRSDYRGCRFRSFVLPGWRTTSGRRRRSIRAIFGVRFTDNAERWRSVSGGRRRIVPVLAPQIDHRTVTIYRRRESYDPPRGK